MLQYNIQCVVLLLKVKYLAGEAGACAACQREYGNPSLISAFYSPCREREEQGELWMKQQD